MPDHDFTHIRRYKRPSLWRRFTWWLAGDHTTLCHAAMVIAALYFAWAIGAAARSGALGAGW